MSDTIPVVMKRRRRKAPRGRSVPMEAATGYCDYDCPGYGAEPNPGHFWPNEEPELRARITSQE